MFFLRKWYLDCVTEGGDAFIGYSARLRWGALRVRYTSALVAPARDVAVERYSFLPLGAPRLTVGGGLRWRCRRLGLAAAWRARAEPIERVLLRDGAGAPVIEWACVAPAAAARVRVRGATLAGLGYAERLTLALEPWRLPFQTLCWGRFVAPQASLVWIAWENDAATSRASAAIPATPALASSFDDAAAVAGASAPQAEPATAAVAAREAPGGPVANASFLFRDSRPVELRELAPGRLTAADGTVLELTGGTVLHDAPVVSAPLRRLPLLAARVPAPFLAAREEKWLSRGTLHCPGTPPLQGWAIHERVRFA